MSLKTVSRVVNGISTVDAHLAERVRAASAELGFRPNQMAATLKSGAATAMIGLVIKDISNEFYASITQGAAEVAGERDVQLITSSATDENVSDESERSTIFELCRRRADGLIIVPRSHDQSQLAREIEMGTPMVFVDRSPIGLDADAVVLDNKGGAASAIGALADAGHRRIGIVLDSLGIATMRDRHDGARAEKRRRGLPDDDALVRTDAHGPDASAHAVAELLESADPPTAIFCGNNRATIGAVEEVWRRRATVALAGFDDFNLAHLMPVPLTLVTYDTTELGRRAARMLFERIDGYEGPGRTEVLPVRVRASGIHTLQERTHP
ncbi:LacI family transcriptional regulator [Microbacterium trichothecenolyticum]|nr:LacI family transcriptional regulator [Microbacterium trichothecenolyticum]